MKFLFLLCLIAIGFVILIQIGANLLGSPDIIAIIFLSLLFIGLFFLSRKSEKDKKETNQIAMRLMGFVFLIIAGLILFTPSETVSERSLLLGFLGICSAFLGGIFFWPVIRKEEQKRILKGLFGVALLGAGILLESLFVKPALLTLSMTVGFSFLGGFLVGPSMKKLGTGQGTNSESKASGGEKCEN